jgi:hypothetical protein
VQSLERAGGTGVEPGGSGTCADGTAIRQRRVKSENTFMCAVANSGLWNVSLSCLAIPSYLFVITTNVS